MFHFEDDYFTDTGFAFGVALGDAPDWNWGFDLAHESETIKSRTRVYYFAAAPLWAPVGLLAAVSAILWTIEIRTRRRGGGGGLCPSCGYDRRGLVGGAACPECGSKP